VKKFRGFTLAVIFAVTLPVFGQFSEYEIKAAYLFNFAKFVTWPASDFDNSLSPILIGILGDDPFGADLNKMIEGKMVDGHPLRLKRFGAFDGIQIPQLRKCQILFISYSEKAHITAILQVMHGTNALTVSEIEKFPTLGGMVFFDQEGQKITLTINLTAAKREKLDISSKLLQVAKVYKSE
jgi:hypothetical protein